MSEIRATTISNLAGTGPATLTGQIAHKAMATYSQVANSVLKSTNVSSVSDDSTGNYTVSFTSAFSDVNYHSGNSGSGNAVGSAFPLTVSTMSCRTQVASTGIVLDATSYPTAAGDLA